MQFEALHTQVAGAGSGLQAVNRMVDQRAVGAGRDEHTCLLSCLAQVTRALSGRLSTRAGVDL